MPLVDHLGLMSMRWWWGNGQSRLRRAEGEGDRHTQITLENTIIRLERRINQQSERITLLEAEIVLLNISQLKGLLE